MARLAVEQHRHDCECRYWWKATHGNHALIREALKRIGKMRSAAGVEKLRQGLRELWRVENADSSRKGTNGFSDHFFGQYERCVFCGDASRYWHMETNNCVCQSCASRHDVSELKNWRVKHGNR